MTNLINKFMDWFKLPNEQERLYAYLSQAVDRVHLEYLQKEWDRKSYNERSMW